jgi:hypothetical protein
MRNVFAVIVGVATAGFVVMGVETLGHSLYPPPAGLSMDNPQAIEAYLANAPFLALAFVLIAWACGALVGGAVAARVAVGRRTARFGTTVGLVLLLMGAITMWSIKHPLWFMLAAPFACLIPGRIGGQLGRSDG